MKYLLPLLLVALCLRGNAQNPNMVPDGSFEQYISCPSLFGQIWNTVHWNKYTSGTPDYFNSCATIPQVNVPANYWGSEAAAGGNAYAGLLTYTSNLLNNEKEYLTSSIAPLQPGSAYTVSMLVSLSDSSSYGTDDLGVFFYDNGPNFINILNVFNVTPQISYTNYGPVVNKTGWAKLSKTFVADSTYDHVVIGGFSFYNVMGKTPVPGGHPLPLTYYYIDSVVVALEDTLTMVFNDSLLCAGDTVTVPFILKSSYYGTNNIISLQLSSPGGSFASPVTIGSLATNSSGVVKGVIPSNITPGLGYKIRLASSNVISFSKPSQNIAIGLAKPAKPVISILPTCERDTIKLNVTSSSTVTNWKWHGPVNFMSNLQNPVIPNADVSMAGNYYVTAYSYGCHSKDTELLSILPLPLVSGSSNSPVCEMATLNLATINAGAGVTYTWTGPASFSAGIQNPAITNISSSQAGDYVVAATLNGCTAKDTVTVQTKLMPAIPIVSNSGPVCVGSSLNMAATSSNSGVSYNWVGPLSYTSTAQNPTITNTTTSMSGVYSVTATLNGCTSAAGSTVATVNLTPVTPTAGSNSPVCAGGILNLTANSTTPGVNYNWTGPNAYTANTQNPSISPAPLNGSGTYAVTAELNGCISTGSGSTNVVVNNISSLGVYPSPNDTVCINNANASFVAVPFNAGTSPQYQWYKNNNLVGGATSISYLATGIADGDSFYCRMTVTGLCADPLILYSNKVGMTVLPLTSGPSVSITADPGTLLSPWQLVKFTAVASNAGALPKYQWKRNSQDIIGANSNVWSANNLSNGDTISCIVTSNVWCASPASDVSNRMVVNIKTGIKDMDGGGEMVLYPNPNSGSFIIDIPLAPFKGGNLRVDVVDAVGRIVYSTPIAIGAKWEVVLPASVANGVYLLKLHADGVVYHARFTVSR